MRPGSGLVVLSIVVASAAVPQEGPHPFSDAGRWGYLDSEGSIVIPPRFNQAGWFVGGFAPVRSSSSWFLIGQDGAELPRLSFALRPETPVSEGLLAAKVDAEAKFGFFSLDGVLRILPRFDDVRPFSEGLAAVKEGGRWFFIGRDGAQVSPASYDYAGSFSEGYAVVKVGGKAGFVDHAGNFLAPLRFDDARGFSSGVAAVEVAGKWGYLASNGEMAIEALFDEARSFSEGLAPVKQGFLWGYIDRSGRFRLPAKFRLAGSFSCGLAAVEDSVVWKTGYVNQKGLFEISPRFQSGDPFSADGVARVVLMPRAHDYEAHRNLDWAYINRRGVVIWTNVRGGQPTSRRQ